MNIKKWFNELFQKVEPFRIEGHFYCADIDAAKANGEMHLAMWGNCIVDLVDFTTRIGPRQVLALKVNKPEMLKDMSNATRKKIQAYLMSEQFIWDKTLFVFHRDHFGYVITVTTDSLTPYHELVPA